MNKFNMFITAVCALFLIKLRWPKNKSIYGELYKRPHWWEVRTRGILNQSELGTTMDYSPLYIFFNFERVETFSSCTQPMLVFYLYDFINQRTFTTLNRPFLSCLVLQFQNKTSCNTFHMEIRVHINVVPRSTRNTNVGTVIHHLNRPRLSLCDLVAQSTE